MTDRGPPSTHPGPILPNAVTPRRSPPADIRYPDDLPISARRDEILAALREHQVVIVAGETGSGKSTQLPKMCLELGRGVDAMIGHTQPRRIAARSVAERIAEELGTEVGGAVGYAVRFTDRVSDRTLVKVMTDGILLAELPRDRLLRRYDTIIVDEAHERSLNVDFLLGYLRRILPERPDLSVIVTSATIATERFADFFGGAPVVEVSGRSYPVEVRYRPLDELDGDQVQGVCDAVEELCGEGPGDILVFLSGEREIRDTTDALGRLRLDGLELLPLYARLPAAEQHRVFQPHPGRRVVLATNVAETSLTVPGVRFVVDAGTARVSRYNRRTKVQRLPIEAVSQASADQRAGRCGRVAPGVCIRLYSEDDYLARPRFTDPEILRTNLASVILQMAALGLGDVAAFPFVDPPDARSITDGLTLLDELGAVVADRPGGVARLTPAGRRLARLPIDPRLGRMILEADRRGCTREVMVIAAALSIQDPRERPADDQQAAAEHHARFADKTSDFMSYLALWEYLRDRQRTLSSSQFRRLCRDEHLNFLRVREWQDLYSQLRQLARAVGITLSATPASRDAIHASILAGLLSHLGMHDPARGDYLGARNARFAIAPGSALRRRTPRWVMAAELVETDRLRARTVAAVEPAWAERLGAHLVKRSHGEPVWDPARGAGTVVERVTLYGLPVAAGRRVPYAKVDRAGARAMFVQHALVEGDWDAPHAFLHDNAKLLDEARALEDRLRRRDLLAGDGVLFAFFDERVPAGVASGRDFDRWWARERRRRPGLLTYPPELLIDPAAAAGLDLAAFPDVWRCGGLDLDLSYVLEPGAPDDGVTVHVPLALLNQLDGAGFDWQVPGLRHELAVALVRALPKSLRRSFVPVPDVVGRALSGAGPAEGPLLAVLEERLAGLTGVRVPQDAWDLDAVPDHLRVRFSVEEEHGRVVGAGRDLDELRAPLAGRVRAAVAAAVRAGATPGSVPEEVSGLTAWTIGSLPRVVEAGPPGRVVRAFPALVDEGDTAGVRLLASEAAQARAMRAGTRRLLLRGAGSPTRALQRLLTTGAKLAIAHSRYENAGALIVDCIEAAVDELVDEAGGPAWDEPAFARLRDHVRAGLVDRAVETVERAGRVLVAGRRVEERLGAFSAPVYDDAVVDVEAQLARLLRPGFVSATTPRRLPDVARYVEAAGVRLQKLGAEPARDRERMALVRRLERELAELRATAPPDRPAGDLEEIGWMIEELRVGLFAQSLGTPRPVSAARIERAMDRLCE